MRMKILAAALVLAASPAYAADPIGFLPTDISDARASTGQNGSAGSPAEAGSGICRPTLFGGCARNYGGDSEGQRADVSRPDPSPSTPSTPSTPSNPDPGPSKPDPEPTKPDPEPTKPDPEPTKPDPEKSGM